MSNQYGKTNGIAAAMALLIVAAIITLGFVTGNALGKKLAEPKTSTYFVSYELYYGGYRITYGDSTFTVKGGFDLENLRSNLVKNAIFKSDRCHILSLTKLED